MNILHVINRDDRIFVVILFPGPQCVLIRARVIDNYSNIRLFSSIGKKEICSRRSTSAGITKKKNNYNILK